MFDLTIDQWAAIVLIGMALLMGLGAVIDAVKSGGRR